MIIRIEKRDDDHFPAGMITSHFPRKTLCSGLTEIYAYIGNECGIGETIQEALSGIKNPIINALASGEAVQIGEVEDLT